MTPIGGVGALRRRGLGAASVILGRLHQLFEVRRDLRSGPRSGQMAFGGHWAVGR